MDERGTEPEPILLGYGNKERDRFERCCSLLPLSPKRAIYFLGTSLRSLSLAGNLVGCFALDQLQPSIIGRRPWTEQEDYILLKCRAGGGSFREVGWAMGRSERACRDRHELLVIHHSLRTEINEEDASTRHLAAPSLRLELLQDKL